MCMIDGLDGYDRVNTSHVRKARKQHKCQECYRVIEVGETYQITSGIDSEGDPFAYKICGHCKVAATWLSDNCGGWVRSGLHEDIYEHVEEYRRTDLARLYVAMKRKWKRFRSEGLIPIPKLPRPLKLGDLRG